MNTKYLEKSLHSQCGKCVDMVMKSSLIRKSLDNVTCLIVAFKNFENCFDLLSYDKNKNYDKVPMQVPPQSAKNVNPKVKNFTFPENSKEKDDGLKTDRERQVKLNEKQQPNLSEQVKKEKEVNIPNNAKFNNINNTTNGPNTNLNQMTNNYNKNNFYSNNKGSTPKMEDYKDNKDNRVFTDKSGGINYKSPMTPQEAKTVSKISLDKKAESANKAYNGGNQFNYPINTSVSQSLSNNPNFNMPSVSNSVGFTNNATTIPVKVPTTSTNYPTENSKDDEKNYPKYKDKGYNLPQSATTKPGFSSIQNYTTKNSLSNSLNINTDFHNYYTGGNNNK